MYKLHLKASLKRFWHDERGLGTLEILLIVAVLVAIAIIFRKWIAQWFQQMLGDANTKLKSDTSLPSCVPNATTNCTS